MSRRDRGTSAPLTLFSFQDLITSLSGILILLVLLMAVEVALRRTAAGGATDTSEIPPDIEPLRARVDALSQETDALKKKLDGHITPDKLELVQRVTAAEREREDLRQMIERSKTVQRSMELQLQTARANEARTNRDILPLKEELARLRSAMTKAVEQSKIFFIPEQGVLKTPVLVECAGNGIRVGFIDRDTKAVAFRPDNDGIREFDKHLKQFSPSREYFVFMIKPSGLSYWSKLLQRARTEDFDVGYDALEENLSVGFGGERL